jgi:hypothetical protein
MLQSVRAVHDVIEAHRAKLPAVSASGMAQIGEQYAASHSPD